jgi:hypothetical protein
MPPVFNAATAPAEAHHPDPDRAEPTRIGQVLGLVRTLIAYGKNLAETLRQHTPDPQVLPCFTFLTIIFDTSDLAQILARITRGLLRAAALEERLRRLAARGHDLKQQPADTLPQSPSDQSPSDQSPSDPRAAKPATPPRRQNQDLRPVSLPMFQQIAGQDRRRPIGAVLADICLDLGIVPDQMDYATWDELRRAVSLHGGNPANLTVRCQRKPRAPLSAADIIPIPLAGQPGIEFPPWPAPQSKAPASTGPP